MIVPLRFLFMLGLLAGCDRVFELERIDDADPATSDGRVVGERPSFCESAALFDAFDTSIPCGFGAPSEGSSLAQQDGVLDITIDGSRTLFAGCSAYQPLPFTEAGIFVHIIEPLRVPNAYTQLTVRNTYQTTPDFTTAIVFVDNKLQFFVNGTSIMQRDDVPTWWRLRVPVGRTMVAAELSNDGIHWEPFGSGPASLPPSFALDIGAGINATPSTAGTATFSAVGVCN